MEKAKKLAPLSIALVICLILSFSQIAHQWQKISGFLLPDSDDIMRTLRVREWLSGQGFFDNLEHRANPPIGASIHWSRISDAPLAFFELILCPIFGAQLGESIAIFILPPLLGLLAIFIIGKIAIRLGGNHFSYFLAAALVIFSSSANLSFVFGRVDHHNLQLIALCSIIYGIIRNDKLGGIICGIALGLSIAIGFEMLPLEIVAICLFCLFWAFGNIQTPSISAFSISFAVAILAGFLVDVAPQNYLIQANDFLSIAQLIPLLTGALGLYGISRICNSKLSKLGGLVIVAVIIAIIAWQFGELHRPIYWQVSPFLRDLWFDKFAEVLPLSKLPMQSQLAVLMPILLAIMCAIFMLTRVENGQKSNWILLIILLIVASTMTYFWQNRVHPHATLIATIILASILPQILTAKNLQFLLMAVFILAPLNGLLKPKSNNQENVQYGELFGCDSKEDFGPLATMPKGLLLNNIDLGMKALIQTPHDIITTPFHRDMGREIVSDIFLSNASDSLAKIKAHKIKYVAICMYHREVKAFADFRPNSFIGEVANGKDPQYLRPLKMPANSKLRAFEVIN